MKMLRTDTWIAIFMLLLVAVFWVATGQIRETDYGQMGSEVWPRVVLGILMAFSLLLLWQSLHSEPPAQAEQPAGNWFFRYRNAIACYALFFVFLLTLPYFGMLIGGVLFVFGMLTALGGGGLSALIRHGLIAVGSVGMMWAIFTFGLNVILPQGIFFTTL